jgi:hypothetical protein
VPCGSVDMTEAGWSLPAVWPAFAHAANGLDGGELSLEIDGRRCVIIGPPLLAQQYNADRRWMARQTAVVATAKDAEIRSDREQSHSRWTTLRNWLPARGTEPRVVDQLTVGRYQFCAVP